MCEILAWLVTFSPMPNSSNLHIRWNLILLNIPIFRISLKLNTVWKYTLNPNADKIHFETNNSTQLCLGDTPETNNWWDTRQKCHNLGVGQLFSKSVCYFLPLLSGLSDHRLWSNMYIAFVLLFLAYVARSLRPCLCALSSSWYKQHLFNFHPCLYSWLVKWGPFY